MKTLHTVIILILAVAIAFVAFNYLSVQNSSSLNELAEVEIRNYNGTNLSSILGFRENSIRGTQLVDNTTYRLAIKGLVGNPVNFTYQEVLALPHYKKVVTLRCVEGWDVTILWEGTLIKDLLIQAGLNGSGNTLIFRANDGYSTSLPLDYVLSNNIIIASKMNNVTLPPERGFPFQLVSESKWGYKWIKWVTEIEVSNDFYYRGYWESRGYSNVGDLGSGFRGS
jgi:DMSO/TMAO reductase YedYZ molybdopterin-dependent catalytic subunit